jgi:hypothetical protein
VRQVKKLQRLWAQRFAIMAVASVSVACCSVAMSTLRANQPSEFTVKAAFVVSFLKFVEWPASAPGTPLVLLLIGDAPIADALKDSTVGLQIGDRPVHFRRASSANRISDAHAVFITSGEHQQLSAILRQLERKHVLTIGDTEGFGASGVVLNLVMQDTKVRVEANTAAAARAGLKVSAHLLRLARIVG